MLRYLLDTSIVSSPVSKVPDPGVLARLADHDAECAIAAPVWHELTYGCRRLPRGRRRAALEAYLEEVVRPSFPILAYDEAAAAWHATERARLEGEGRPAPFVDGQIAAIARVNQLVLVTLNTKDFVVFRELDVESWAKGRGKGASPPR
jgi:tRNA(fMet)-specific endonuclease VapC